MKKRILSVILACSMVYSVGCATWAARGGTAETKYFAALTDWNTAKEAATIAVGSESVPIPIAEKIVNVMKQGDAAIAEIEAARVAGTFNGDKADILLKTLLRLKATLIRESLAAGANASTLHPDTETEHVPLRWAAVGVTS